ncbi:MAG: FAD binding domain-containing protein [Pseudomonadota bacterium]
MSYARPTSLQEALQLRAGPDPVTVLAGGTDLYPATDRPALSGAVLDITAIEGLSDIVMQGPDLRIGAATRWSALVAADLPAAFDGVKAAAREVGSVQIQNAGTLGGNLCNASPAADGVPPLLTLDAKVELASLRGIRRLALAAFLTGARQTALAPDEILTAIVIPKTALAGRSAFAKLGARRYLVISIAMVAARIETARGRIVQAALAVGACSAVARRLTALETALIGVPLSDVCEVMQAGDIGSALTPIDDVRGTAGYRRDAASELLRRLVGDLLREDAARAA